MKRTASRREDWFCVIVGEVLGAPLPVFSTNFYTTYGKGNGTLSTEEYVEYVPVCHHFFGILRKLFSCMLPDSEPYVLHGCHHLRGTFFWFLASPYTLLVWAVRMWVFLVVLQMEFSGLVKDLSCSRCRIDVNHLVRKYMGLWGLFTPNTMILFDGYNKNGCRWQA